MNMLPGFLQTVTPPPGVEPGAVKKIADGQMLVICAIFAVVVGVLVRLNMDSLSLAASFIAVLIALLLSLLL